MEWVAAVGATVREDLRRARDLVVLRARAEHHERHLLLDQPREVLVRVARDLETALL